MYFIKLLLYIILFSISYIWPNYATDLLLLAVYLYVSYWSQNNDC